MSTHSTVDRESFQKLLASAFLLQQSQIDSQSFSAIVEGGPLIMSGEADMDGATHLIADRLRKGANTRGAQLPLPELKQDILMPGAFLAHWARALSAQDTGLATKAEAVATPPARAEWPSALDSMNACSAASQVRTPELKTAPVRLRDPWMPLLLSLVIALASLVIWMLGRVTVRGSAHPQGPPLRVIAEPDATPVRLEEAGQADPSPPPPVRANSISPEAGSDSLVVYQNGRVIFRLKSPPRRGESSAPGPAPASPRKTKVRLLQRVEPKYPEAAKQQHIQGLVVLEAKVDEGGAVEQLTVISGNSMLAAAASDAVRKWRFKALVQKGRVVPFQTRVKVNFVLP